VLLLSGQTVSRLGSRVSDIALPLLVLALTNSPVQAGLIAATQSLPYLLLSLPAGALLDRWDRKRVMILCDAARGLAMLSILLTYATTHLLGLGQLYAVAVVVGVALVFFDVAEGAALPQVAPTAHLTQAVGLTATTEAATYLLGPGLAGVLIGLGSPTVAGAALAYLMDGLSYLASLLMLRAIRLPFQAERAPGAVLSGRALRTDIVAGLRFLWEQRHLRLLVLLGTGINMLDGSLMLAVIVLARAELHATAGVIGLIFTPPLALSA